MSQRQEYTPAQNVATDGENINLKNNDGFCCSYVIRKLFFIFFHFFIFINKSKKKRKRAFIHYLLADMD